MRSVVVVVVVVVVTLAAPLRTANGFHLFHPTTSNPIATQLSKIDLESLEADFTSAEFDEALAWLDSEDDVDNEDISDGFVTGPDLSNMLSTNPLHSLSKQIQSSQILNPSGSSHSSSSSSSSTLPGDYQFDPLKISTNFDPFSRYVYVDGERRERVKERPPGLVLRDYREAEIRHGRLAMLAAIAWPIQELTNNWLLPISVNPFSIVDGGPTLPYIPFIMFLAIFGLGYLDIFAGEIKRTETGEAYLPGECFWDPMGLKSGMDVDEVALMQEREVMNGRAAMLAVGIFAVEELNHGIAVTDIPFNQLLFKPWPLINWDYFFSSY